MPEYHDQVEREFQQKWKDDDQEEENMKTIEQIANDVIETFADEIYAHCTHEQLVALETLVLAALQQRDQEHEAQVAGLTKERDDAREDAKRLDWLSAQDILTLDWITPTGMPCSMIVDPNKRFGIRQSLRAAITQAMTRGAE